MAAGFVAAEGWASGKSPNTKIVVIGSGKNGLPIIVENPQDCFESTRCSSAPNFSGRARQLVGAFPPFDRAPCALGRFESELLDRDRLMPAVAAHQLRWSPAPRPPFGRQRRHARRPDRGVRSRAGDVARSQRRDIRTQIGLGAIKSNRRKLEFHRAVE